MRVPLGWLAELVDLPAQAELEERLTLAGLEIEEVLRTGPDLSAIRIGHVLERRQHPNADRLLVLRLSLGNEERTVVSGIAKWYRPEELVGKKVVLVANL